MVGVDHTLAPKRRPRRETVSPRGRSKLAQLSHLLCGQISPDTRCSIYPIKSINLNKLFNISAILWVVRPENPETVRPDAGNGYRVTVPNRLVPTWFGSATATGGLVRLVPLVWKRELGLPDGHQLEAWFVWSEADRSEDWIIDPRSLLDSDQPSGNVFHLRGLIYEGSFTLTDRKHRLTCAGLLRYLAEKTLPRLWITDEQTSLGVMTDFAFHTTYGKLRP